jgi:hypothetical protein
VLLIFSQIYMAIIVFVIAILVAVYYWKVIVGVSLKEVSKKFKPK